MKLWIFILSLAFPCFGANDLASLHCALQVAMGRFAVAPVNDTTNLPDDFQLSEAETTDLHALYKTVKGAMDNTLDPDLREQYAEIAGDIELLFIASFHRLIYTPQLKGWVKALHMSDAEVLSIATIGILYGMDHWNSGRGAFSTYVVYCFKRPLLATRAQQQGISRAEATRLGQLGRAEERLVLALERKPTDEEWETESGLSHPQFREACELSKRLAYEASGESGREPIQFSIPDHREAGPDVEADAANLRDQIDRTLTSLEYRGREIFKLRYGLGDGYSYTMEETARIFKVSRERVRAIEARAAEKLTGPRKRSDQLTRFVERVAALSSAPPQSSRLLSEDLPALFNSLPRLPPNPE